MKSRIFMSMFVIALAALMIGGATMAWFTDSASTPETTFTAGTLMIDIENFDVDYEVAKLDILNPGDQWRYNFDVKNSGTKRFIYKLAICWQDQLGNTLVDFGGREGFGTDPLSEVVLFNIYRNDEEIAKGKTLVELLQAQDPSTPPLEFVIGQLNPGDNDYFAVYAYLPETAGNEYQGSKMKLAFVVLAKQIHDEAEYPEFECPLLPPFPSTNYLNASGQNPHSNPAPYVELVSATKDSITLNLVNPRNWQAVFEIRVDGADPTSTPHWAAPYYDFLPDDEKVYQPYYVVTNGEQEVTIPNVARKVEVRHAAGGESNCYFDWTPFYVIPANN